jgi:hypothetical protein
MVVMSKHHPDGNGSKHLDNGQLEAAIARHQNGEVAALAEIVRLIQPRTETMIRFYGTNRYKPEDELLSDVHWKMLRAVGKFDSARGSGFSFVSHVIFTALRTAVTSVRKNGNRFTELDEALVSTLPANGATDPSGQEGIDDLAHRIRSGIKTTVTDPTEQDVQRWYVTSFVDGAFGLPRHECANAAMAVYSLSHERSRELYDLTLLSVRRLVYDDLPSRPLIAPGRLAGTRCAWMMRYRPLLSDTELTKFTVLLRNLSPYLLLLLDPESRSRRQDRNPPIGRHNIEWVLNGHPDAVPLFP